MKTEPRLKTKYIILKIRDHVSVVIQEIVPEDSFFFLRFSENLILMV